ncbi:hypothetical protein QN277_027968 [Acacia crassicarpa]|uniref:Calcium-transporting ATPase n=1 Tax=Acacia crassicarpa TaxID=499986 RepID=A0AAE1MHR8_9FABA|nr:hypothetical protein QN277_027968 [Acacia crassicarpa]
MEKFLTDERFTRVRSKNSSREALEKWRNLCGIVKNPKRRFRFTANLSKRDEADAMRRTNQELRVAILVSKAAIHFTQGVSPSDYVVPEDVNAEGFQICAEELGSIVDGRDIKKLQYHGGVNGLAGKLSASITDGLSNDTNLLNKRKKIYGINKFTESEARSFWGFVWEALQDMTPMIHGVCALVSVMVGIAMEGWPHWAHDGLGIVASILLVVFVTATSDYRQSLQFKDLDKEKKITIQVTRNGYRQKVSIYDLLPGDIVHLAIGDQVPADGLFLSGFSVMIDESCVTGESVPVMVSSENPFLLSGSKVEDGSCKMMVTKVGMRTQWGKLMATLSEGDDETPLQVKLNGVATIIGTISRLFFAVVAFSFSVQGLLTRKFQEGSLLTPVAVTLRYVCHDVQRSNMFVKVWRLMGFGSSITGFICFALGPSFQKLFGRWNLLKIVVYCILSSMFSLFILFANRFRLRLPSVFLLKVLVNFLVLLFTSLYSYYDDLAVMSMSLSIQLQPGFEVGMSNFFLGCLVLGFMKKNLLEGLGVALLCFIVMSIRAYSDFRQEQASN